jgi:uncharacterized protein YggE
MTKETTGNKLYILLVILSIGIVTITAGLYASAAGADTKLEAPEQRELSVSGSASEFVVPDTASINIGVLTQASTTGEASQKNNDAMTSVINALKSLGLGDREIQTSFLSIQPLYRSPAEGETPNITGYSASNNVQVTTKMLGNLSDIVDRAVAAGANQVSGISFTVSEEKRRQINDELLVKAVNDSSAKASLLAESLKVRITGVRTASISEVAPPPVFAPAAVEKTGTPIQPGESQVSLSVQVTYMIE